MSYLDYKIIKKLSEDPQVSQRQLSQDFGVSLGKINFVLKALINKGLIKATNFKNSHNKRAYFYQLTPRGLKHKTQLTVEFLRIKTREYHQLQKEIEVLKKDIES